MTLEHDDKIRQKIKQEAQGKGWRWMKRGMLEYDHAFVPVLDERLPYWIAQRAKTGAISVFDVMGFGKIAYDIARSFPLSWGASLSLEHSIPQVERGRAFEQQQIMHFTGNVTDQRTWEAIRSFQREHTLPNIDLIVIAPIAGFKDNYFYGGAGAYDELLHNAWLMLTGDNGMLLTEVPPWMHLGVDDYSFSGWLGRIQEQSGGKEAGNVFASLAHGGEILRLTKTHDAMELPRMRP